jgi:hypothetical protein
MRSPKEQLIIDTEFDSIGEQLGISAWIWAFMIGGISIFLLALIYWAFKCLAVMIEWIF